MHQNHSRPTLGNILCPTLVLVGDSDELTPPILGAEIADGIAGARLVTVPDCGHASSLERPGHVTEALLELIRDLMDSDRASAGIW